MKNNRILIAVIAAGVLHTSVAILDASANHCAAHNPNDTTYNGTDHAYDATT